MTAGSFDIRKSRKHLLGYTVLSGSFIAYYFLGPYDHTRIIFQTHPAFTIALGIIMLILFLFFSSELIQRKTEIRLSELGIEIRDKSLFSWSDIQHFSTIRYTDRTTSNQDLILHIDGVGKIVVDISHLEKSCEEIVELIRQYSTNRSIVYDGHTNE